MRNLASVLLPATQRQAPPVEAAAASSSRAAAASSGRRGRGGRPAWECGRGSEPQAAAGRQEQEQEQAAAEPAWDGTFGSGSRWGNEAQSASSRRERGGGLGSRLDPLPDICERLCSQPGYRLLTLRSCPQLPPSSFDYTAFSWRVVLKNLKQMQLAGKGLEAGLDWTSRADSGSVGSSSSRRASLGGLSSSALGSLGAGVRSGNKALASLLVFR
jgi:hypothetical protein